MNAILWLIKQIHRLISEYGQDVDIIVTAVTLGFSITALIKARKLAKRLFPKRTKQNGIKVGASVALVIDLISGKAEAMIPQIQNNAVNNPNLSELVDDVFEPSMLPHADEYDKDIPYGDVFPVKYVYTGKEKGRIVTLDYTGVEKGKNALEANTMVPSDPEAVKSYMDGLNAVLKCLAVRFRNDGVNEIHLFLRTPAAMAAHIGDVLSNNFKVCLYQLDRDTSIYVRYR